jgi:hypothetical protein
LPFCFERLALGDVESVTVQTNSFRTRTIQHTNRTGSFSTIADYTPLDNGTCRIDERTWDELGIIPNGVESRTLQLGEAQAEYRDRKAHGWS